MDRVGEERQRVAEQPAEQLDAAEGEADAHAPAGCPAALAVGFR
jgi:hypothetical protein